MKIDFIAEPELEFGTGKSIDIRFGIMNYFPVDYNTRVAPKSIRAGIVGNNETVEGVTSWLEKCRNEIPAKQSNQPNLFPKFPGFSLDGGFKSELVLDSSLQRTISQKRLDELQKTPNGKERVTEAVNLFLEELIYLNEKMNLDVLICAIPQAILEIGQPSIVSDDDEEIEYYRDKNTPDFHDMLKAKVMGLGIPIQLVLPSTYDSSKKRSLKTNPAMTRMLQDEATRAWNFHTALYYKAKGIPWRLLRNPSDFSTCYIGVSFFRESNDDVLRTSVAQVFNERGEGVIVRGGLAKFNKDDRQVHLDEKDATALLVNSLNLYKREHGTFPARIVVHKSSTFSPSEKEGFLAGSSTFGIDKINLLSVDKSFTRLFRAGKYPPLRGTFLSLDEHKHILYTRGSVPFFATYPGMYVPKTFGIQCELTEDTPIFLAKEVLSLTKMNWNNTQFDGGEPITIRASRQVGRIMKYISENDVLAPSYRFYM